MKVFYGYTLYQMLIFLLKNDIDKNSVIFIFHKKFPKKVVDIIVDKHYEYYLVDPFVTSNKEDSKVKKTVDYIKKLIENKNIVYSGILKKIRGMDIYGESTLSPLFYKKKNRIIALEDGTINYIEHKNIKFDSIEDLLKKMLTYFFWRTLPTKLAGRSKEVSKIYLTGLAPIPKDIQNKVEIIDLKKLWDTKSQREQIEILEIFNFTNLILNNLKNSKIILFTQPISELGFVTEEEKIEIYKKALYKYKLKDILIKVHPAENTNYREYFSDALIMDDPFPFELITLMGIQIKKAITLYSSVALSLNKEVEIEWLGTDVHPKLKKSIGDRMKCKIETKVRDR